MLFVEAIFSGYRKIYFSLVQDHKFRTCKHFLHNQTDIPAAFTMSKKFMIIRSKSREACFFTNEKLLEISRSGKQVALLSNDFYDITHLSWWYVDRMTDEEIDENIITRIFPSFVNVMPNLVHLDVDKMFEWYEQDIVMAPTNVDFQYLGGLTHLSMACNYLREVN